MKKASLTTPASESTASQTNSKQQETNGPTVTFISEDGQALEVERQCARQVGLIRNMLDMSPPDSSLTFPLANVKSTIMTKVIEFIQFHQSDVSLPDKDAFGGSLRRQEIIDEDDPKSGQTPNFSALRLQGDSEAASSNDFSSSDDEDLAFDDDDEYLHEEYLCNVTPWDQKFMDSLDLATLLELTKAANYLNITLLLDLCCRTIAKQMTGLKAEELRKKFNLTNDFTPEEEAKMAAEFAWIDE